MTDLVYAYAFLPAEAAQSIEAAQPPGQETGVPGAGSLRAISGLTGVEGTPVAFFAPTGRLAVAVGAVPASQYEAEPLNNAVSNLDWLSSRAVSHQQVNAYLFERASALLPLTFGTIFRDARRLAEVVREEEAALLERLALVQGKAEWVLTVQREDDVAATAYVEQASEAMQRLRDELAAAGQGRAYLLRRQIDDVKRQEVLRLDALAVDETLRAVHAAAAAVHQEPLPEKRPNGVIGRASVLVERANESAFAGALEELRGAWAPRGYSATATGPWPAYWFGADHDDE